MAEQRTEPLLPILYEDVVRAALREDLGRAGDLTTDAVVPEGLTAGAALVAREAGRVAGMDVALAAFRLLDPGVWVKIVVPDGTDVAAGDTIAEVQGPARALLTAERTALNLLGRMSGVATLTRAYVEAVAGTRARVTATRKTTPGLRLLERYAVRCGGGASHRFGLDDAVLIKDNHVAIAGGVRPAVQRARGRAGHMVKVELEVDTLAQLEEALELGVDAVLLDNMDVGTVAEAVRMVARRCVTEASGGITLQTVAAVAATGVDILSVGALTHSAPSLDVAMEIG